MLYCGLSSQPGQVSLREGGFVFSGRNPDGQLHCKDSQCARRGIWIWLMVGEGGRNGPHGNWRSEILHLEGKLSRLLSAQNVKLFEKTNTMT